MGLGLGEGVGEGWLGGTRGAGGVVGAALTAVSITPNTRRVQELRIKGGSRQSKTDLERWTCSQERSQWLGR